MARLWSRKPKTSAEPEPPNGERGESVRLDGEDHAWWAQEEVKEAWRPRSAREADATPERDVLAEHFGDDWRTTFGFTPTSDDDLEYEAVIEPIEEQEPDPYEVLGVEPTATWDEIIAAHRRQARVHHPDLLFGQSPEDTAAAEGRIRVINAAYKELRVRRGM